jgi:acyl-CoA dehydrogenase
MLEREIFDDEHEIFRGAVRRFFEEEIVPHHEGWEEQGYVDRSAWLRAGELGFLCTSIPEEYGGPGADRLFSTVMAEEQARSGASGPGFMLHSDIVGPYILRYGSEEQKKTWLPKMAKGEVIAAIGMTEPGAGSDLQSMRTTAVRDGNELVINGSKIFITNGWNCDLLVLACKTDPDARAKGISLVLIENGTPGFEKGRRLKKTGYKAQDTAELFFDNVRVPATNMLGEEGKGFAYLMDELAWERLLSAIRATMVAETGIAQTITYTKDREAFGRPIAGFQNTRFKIAEAATETQILRVFMDKCISMAAEGKLDNTTSAMAKYWSNELMVRVLYECVQLHGGYGVMYEYPIARAYMDSRPGPITAGTSEIMKEIISRDLMK